MPLDSGSVKSAGLESPAMEAIPWRDFFSGLAQRQAICQGNRIKIVFNNQLFDLQCVMHQGMPTA